MKQASKVILVISLCLISLCVTHSSHLPVSMLSNMLSVTEWDSLILLCDVQASECPAEDVLSVRPAVYVSMDLTNRSLIVQMFERHAAPKQLNWLVFCSQCDVLLDEMNTFEATHPFHGYFTHRYQWIIIPQSDTNLQAIQNSVKKISNVLILAGRKIYSAMFGEEDRYLDEIHVLNSNETSKQLLFPNTRNGFNQRTMFFTLMPWATYVIKHDNGSYSGYYPELMEMIAETLNFTIRYTVPPDGKYGSVENGEWNGMIRQLIDKTADFGCVLTKTYDRSAYVDFLHTAVRNIYNTLILYHKPAPAAMTLDVLLKPFSSDVWLAVAASLFLVMLSFHISLRIPSHQSQNRDGFDYIIRSTLNQGAHWSPRHQSSRIIYSIYSLCWIILVSTYTGFLVSFLSVKKEVIPFSTADELAANSEYKLGLLGGGFVQDAILNYNYSMSNPGYYFKQKIQHDMQGDPSVLHPQMNFHEDRLLNEPYAMIADTDTFLSLAAMSCSIALMDLEGRPSQDGYAFPKNSAYGEDVNAVLRAITEGELNINIAKAYLLKPKQCSSSFSSVSLENVHGFFYILVGGMAIASLCVPLEICMATMRKSRKQTVWDDKQSMKSSSNF